MSNTNRFDKLATYFKKKRVEKGISQVELAEKLGFATAQMVSNWERGLCAPPVNSIAALTKILGLSTTEVVELITEENRKYLMRRVKDDLKAL